MPDPFTIIDRLQREWPVITGTPLSFVIAVLITSTVIGLFLRWHYKALLTQKDEQLKTKDEQLTARGQIISEYRERQKADLENKTKDSEQKPLQRTEKKERVPPTLAAQQLLISTLARYGEDPANVTIQIAAPIHRPLGETLTSNFRLAKWQTQFFNIPLETQTHTHISGIEVIGFNKHLVEVVTDALKNAGLSEAKATIEETQVKPDNPKWNYVQHYIRIIIGYYE